MFVQQEKMVFVIKQFMSVAVGENIAIPIKALLGNFLLMKMRVNFIAEVVFSKNKPI